MPKTLFGFYWRMLKEHRWYAIISLTLNVADAVLNISIDPVVAGLILANGTMMMAWQILVMRKIARLSADSAKADSKFGGVNSDGGAGDARRIAAARRNLREIMENATGRVRIAICDIAHH
jgi:hypothetical protein